MSIYIILLDKIIIITAFFSSLIESIYKLRNERLIKFLNMMVHTLHALFFLAIPAFMMTVMISIYSRTQFGIEYFWLIYLCICSILTLINYVSILEKEIDYQYNFPKSFLFYMLIVFEIVSSKQLGKFVKIVIVFPVILSIFIYLLFGVVSSSFIDIKFNINHLAAIYLISLMLSFIVGGFLYESIKGHYIVMRLKSFILWFFSSLVLIMVSVVLVYNLDLSSSNSWITYLAISIPLLFSLKTCKDAWTYLIREYKEFNDENIDKMYIELYDKYSIGTYISKFINKYYEIHKVFKHNMESGNVKWFVRFSIFVLISLTFIILYIINKSSILNFFNRISIFLQEDIKQLLIKLFNGNKDNAEYVFTILGLVGIIIWNIVVFFKKKKTDQRLIFAYLHRSTFYLLMITLITLVRYINDNQIVIMISIVVWFVLTILLIVIEKVIKYMKRRLNVS